MQTLIVGLAAAVIGVAAGYWFRSIFARATHSVLEQRAIELNEQFAGCKATLERVSALSDARAGFESLAKEREESLQLLRVDRDKLHEVIEGKAAVEQNDKASIGRLEAELKNERDNLKAKVELLDHAKLTLANQFEALAGEILEKKTKSFSEGSQKELGSLLSPLQAQIKEFRDKVEQAQSDSKTGVTKLETLIGSLNGLNQQLSQDAKNLTAALRGSSKVQGDWGEFILRDLLEKAGLREGEQYRFQESFGASMDEDGERGRASRTDVILNLPGGRHLVVDSKVSLNAYADYAKAVTDDLRKIALKQHLVSVRAHLDGLARRSYHKLSGLESPDFVVMFVPIEPAFLLALQEAEDLWREAYERSVLLVGPTTLLFVIRIVDNLWQQEQQARSVADIVDRGTKLYEKFVNFVSDLSKIGESLRSADQSYQNAMGKLSTGPGNLIRQTELLKKSGIRTNKQLPIKLLDASGLDHEEQAELSLAASGEEGMLRE